MSRFIIKRLLWTIPVMLGIAILIFSIMYVCPGDPAASLLGNGATQVELQAKREEMGLNDPYLIRLGRYLKQVFIDFDLGDSYMYGTPVIDGLLARMKYTLIIAFTCMGLQILVGTPLGIIAATHRNGLADRFCMFIALLGVSIPAFWLALMMVVAFAVNLNWLPAYGVGGIEFYIMPCLANCFAGIATQARQTRSSMLEVIRSDYVVTAQAKGLSKNEVLLKHALPNALIPIITIVGNGMGMMLGGTVVIENVFSIPGVGNYMMSAIGSRDYPIVMGGVLILGLLFSLIMLLVDIVYAFIDPRIKAQYEGQQRRKKHAA
ncbi:MAG: ABC transporter permease [Clostridiales bacterium]|nr:ABC transporter permease [Clostridiales bacterium]